MNRDELVTRPCAIPPGKFQMENTQAIYPQEPSGGTWIGCNSHGTLLALLNWYEAGSPGTEPKQKTRGGVIPELIGQPDCASTELRLARLSLQGMHPFRLVGAFWPERALWEWRWDGAHLQNRTFLWRRQHWFSSSLSDSAAERGRGQICDAAARAEHPETADWLRGLHRSHGTAPGPFSVCVHRRDAATVSYTEVGCEPTGITMRYLAGFPCQKPEFDQRAAVPFATASIAATLA